jgi:DtxR family Mn-dependent transcriptional regulator
MRNSPPAIVSATMQDYLKAIFLLSGQEGGATTTGLAARLAVTPASVTGMAKKLARLDLVEHELYLAEALGMPWDQVHAEAERLEHVLSEEVEERMAAALGNPLHDPHGSPIPSADGRIAPAERTISLADCAPGTSAMVAEVDDRDPALLRFLAEHGIRPGAAIAVVRPEFGEDPMTITIEIGGRTSTLRVEAAREVRVRPVAEPEGRD